MGSGAAPPLLIIAGMDSTILRPRRHLSEQSGHLAGFDGLRLVGALAVLFSHAFTITAGSEQTEPLVRFLGPGNTAGLYGVFTFFIVSGFLLARSLSADPRAIKYTVNRVLRILPAFVVCMLVCALLIGPVFSSVGFSAYFRDAAMVRRLSRSINTFSDLTLPGLFAYDGPMAHVVNGSLWSLRYEALSYVLLLLLWTVFRSGGLVAGVLVAVAALTRLSPAVADRIAGIAYTLPYFASGVLMNWIHARFGTRRLGLLICGAGLFIGSFLGWAPLAFALFGAYLIVFVGERPNLLSGLANKIGDCSYGLYLYGWPVEQSVKQLTGTTSPWRLMAIALPFGLLLAFLSCHVIEKPAMSLRQPVADFLRRRVQSAVSSSHPFGRAAVCGAKVSFVIGSTLVLISEKRWWYFLESMSVVFLSVVAGLFITIATCRALMIGGLVGDSVDRSAA